MEETKKYEIYAAESFLEDYNRLSTSDKLRIDKIKERLKLNPYAGKPLGHKFFREKKMNGKRLYYLIFEEFIVFLLWLLATRKPSKLR